MAILEGRLRRGKLLPSHLPKRVLKIIDQAKLYAEGTAVRIEVKGPEDVVIVKKLVEIKLGS